MSCSYEKRTSIKRRQQYFMATAIAKLIIIAYKLEKSDKAFMDIWGVLKIEFILFDRLYSTLCFLYRFLVGIRFLFLKKRQRFLMTSTSFRLTWSIILLRVSILQRCKWAWLNAGALFKTSSWRASYQNTGGTRAAAGQLASHEGSARNTCPLYSTREH